MTMQKQALRRYLTLFIPVMVLYSISCFAVPILLHTLDIPKPITYLLALIPAFCIIVSMWSQWRYGQEVDEFFRSVLTNAALVGLTFVMAVSTSWGFLEFFADGPHISLFFVVPAFYASFGVAYGVLLNRAGGKLSMEGDIQ